MPSGLMYGPTSTSLAWISVIAMTGSIPGEQFCPTLTWESRRVPQGNWTGTNQLGLERGYVQDSADRVSSALYFFCSSLGGSGLGVGSLKLSGLRSAPGPTGSQAVEPPSKLRKAWVSSRGSWTTRFFSSS